MQQKSKLYNALAVAAGIVALTGLVGGLFFGPWPQIPVQQPEFHIALAVMVVGLLMALVFFALSTHAARKEQAEERRQAREARKAEKFRHETNFINPQDFKEEV